MSTHPKQVELESKMRHLCDDLDHYLEDTFGGEAIPCTRTGPSEERLPV